MTTNNENYFDLLDIDDLPDDMISDLRLDQHIGVREKIIDLIDNCSEGTVTNTMMVIAMYRKYDMTMTRPFMNYSLSNLAKQGKIRRVSNGHYAKNEQSE